MSFRRKALEYADQAKYLAKFVQVDKNEWALMVLSRLGPYWKITELSGPDEDAVVQAMFGASNGVLYALVEE